MDPCRGWGGGSTTHGSGGREEFCGSCLEGVGGGSGGVFENSLLEGVEPWTAGVEEIAV